MAYDYKLFNYIGFPMVVQGIGRLDGQACWSVLASHLSGTAVMYMQLDAC